MSCNFPLNHIFIHLQVKTSRTFVRDASVASPLALALFGAGTPYVAHEGGYVLLGNWLRFRAPAQVCFSKYHQPNSYVPERQTLRTRVAVCRL